MKSAITARQIRAARALLGWSRDDLAVNSGVPARSLARLESGATGTRAATRSAVQEALEAAGVEFIDDGARLRP